MDPLTISTAAVLASGLDVDPNQSVTILRALAVGVLGLVLLIAGIAAVAGPGRKGNTRKSWDIASASMIGLIPAVLGAAGIALAFGAAVLGWVIPGISG